MTPLTKSFKEWESLFGNTRARWITINTFISGYKWGSRLSVAALAAMLRPTSSLFCVTKMLDQAQYTRALGCMFYIFLSIYTAHIRIYQFQWRRDARLPSPLLPSTSDFDTNLVIRSSHTGFTCPNHFKTSGSTVLFVFPPTPYLCINYSLGNLSTKLNRLTFLRKLFHWH